MTDTPRNPGNKRIYTDKDYLDRRFDDIQRQLAEINAAKLVTHDECGMTHEKIRAELKVLDTFKTFMEGKASQSAVMWIGGSTALSIVITTVGLVMTYLRR